MTDGFRHDSLGNNLVHAATYNNRLQTSEIKLGTAGAPTSILSLVYNNGTTTNNGNIQSVSYSGGGLSNTQTFSYDSLNRLATAQENAGASWTQTNGYDRYANRWIALPGGAQSIYCNTSNNRITGWSYDASGNLLNDGVTNYTYDAEGHIKTVNGTTAYRYDGGGQRVRKLVGENIRFVYGIGGELIAEFDGSTGALKKEYVYGGGTVATIEPTAVNANGTRYATADHLGSPRVVTNSGGGVVSRHDYMPFGEELFAGTGGRTIGMGFSVADGNRQKFTSYERDNETGLDFAQARYYSNTQGRPSGLNYQTSYSYDVLGSLLTVNQGVQARTFVYDSLKRLTSANNPESGTVSNTYDASGNVLTKTDARAITTTIAYDALNRPTTKSHSDGTPAVAYFYDSQSLPGGAPSFSRGYAAGRLVAVTYGGTSTGNYAGFDALGRTIRKIQQTDAVNYLVEGVHNVSGAMTSETYPSIPGSGDRRTITSGFDAAGRLTSTNSNATTYAPAASVSSIS